MVAVADYAVVVEDAGSGSVAFIGYNCVWSAAGQLTNAFYDPSKSKALIQDEGNIEVDPRFADAANGDFRLMNESLLQLGKPDAAGRRSHMGAVNYQRQNPSGLSVGSPIAGAF